VAPFGRGGLVLSVASFCTRCGYANVQGNMFCPNCGNSLAIAPPGAGAPAPTGMIPPPAAPAGPPTAYPYGAPPPGYPPPYYAPPVKRATVSAMIGDTFSVFGKDPLIYVGLFLLYAAVITGLTFLLTFLAFGSPSPTVELQVTATMQVLMDLLLRYILLALIVSLLGAVIQSIVVATVTYFAVQRQRGTPVPVRQAFNESLPRVISVLIAALLMGLLFAAFVTVPFGLFIAGALTGNLGLVGIGVLLLLVAVVVLIYVYVALSLYAPAIVMEGRGAVDGLRRSWGLTRGRRLTLFGAILVLAILAALITLVISTPFGLAGNTYVAGVGTILATAVTGSWSIIWAAVAYHLILSEPRPSPWPPTYTPASPMPPTPPQT